MEYLALLENTKASRAMKRAAKYRRAGYDASTALRLGWQGNPARRTTTFEPSGLSFLLLGSGVAYFIWCAVNKSKTGSWSWTPWKVGLQRRVLLSKNPGHSVVAYDPMAPYDWSIPHPRGSMGDSPSVCPGGKEPTTAQVIKAGSIEPIHVLTRGTNYA